MKQFIFPFGAVPKGSNIVLYGAGDVGKAFYLQIKATDYANLVLWLDKRHEVYRGMGLPVSAPRTIIDSHYDYVVIAVLNEAIANGIKKDLCEMGVNASQIVWSNGYEIRVLNGFKNVDDEFKALEGSDIFKKISPKELVSSNRLDLMVRYLLCRDIINQVENRAHLSLYFRFILIENSGEERIRPGGISEYFVDYEKKQGLTDFIEAFKSLISSMQKNGFLKEKFIALDTENQIINASHRTAAALALEQEVWTKKYEEFGARTNPWDFKWFEDNGFSTDDKIRILRAFSDLYENCGLVVLFGTCWHEWELVRKQLEKHVHIVGQFDLDFSRNFIGFENIVEQIFGDVSWQERNLDLLHFLLLCPLEIRVFLVSDENNKGIDIYNTLESFEAKMHDILSIDANGLNPKALLSCSKNRAEMYKLKNILLSVNNIKQTCLRVLRRYGHDFEARLEKLCKYLRSKNISPDSICMDRDSVMELYGLKQAEKLSFMVSSKYREKIAELFGDLPDEFTVSYKDWTRVDDNTVYPDDLIIGDCNFHFIFNGFKFLNLDLVRACKKFRNVHEDNKLDCRLLELFFDYSASFEDKEILQKQLEREMKRQMVWLN
mgnify:CR=1 FL=1